MSPDRAGVVTWWSTRVALPLLGLGALAVGIGHSSFDRASLEPFFDPEAGVFPLRRSWFFEGVLHTLGKWTVIAATATLLLSAAVGWRKPAWSRHARRAAYLVVCLLGTVAITGAWKALADQVTPWNTVGFGGDVPWPGTSAAPTWWDVFGSPGAHASSGFAWMSLYFVGASLGTRRRWLWLAPGVILGLLFALGQHARGAHQPSHEPWSVVVAWGVACAFAVLFRRIGWLEWTEVPEPAGEDTSRVPEPVLPWLIGSSAALAGLAFFATDQFVNHTETRYPRFHDAFEAVEVSVMSLGLGIAAWLLADKIAALRAREARRVEEERERRFQVLGRMAASVAHEVRNPLQTMRLIVDEQRHEIPGLRDHALQREFEACIERIDRAVELVYRLARPGGGEGERADIAEAARESIVALSRTSAGRVSYAWERDPPPAVVASSRSALRIVIDNLLRNAAEASPPGATVTLDLAARDAQWALRIRNRGSLRAPPPNQVPSSGLGLGVPISRQIAANAGGSIEIAEDDGHVTCTLVWPRGREVGA